MEPEHVDASANARLIAALSLMRFPPTLREDDAVYPVECELPLLARQ
jgi:hypothetical protein